MNKTEDQLIGDLAFRSSQAIPVANLRPNSWNPNVMGEVQLQALRESINKYGFKLVPLVVRPWGDKGNYQIIDGEHRYRLALEMGELSLDCVVTGVDDFNAKKLTQILNRTRGEDDPVKLKELIDSLLVDHSPEEVIEGMAIEDASGLDDLLGSLDAEISDLYNMPNNNEGSTTEIDPNAFDFEHTCPKCGFEFNE